MTTIDIRNVLLSSTDPPIATNPNPDLAIKAPVRVATTGNINLQTIGLGTIDGVALAAGDRVLVKNQTDTTTNGIYNAATSTWTRSIDGNNNSQWTQGTAVTVTKGTVNQSTLWGLTSPDPPIILGTSLLTFTQLTLFGAATPTTITNRQIFTYTPVYDFGPGNAYSTVLLFPLNSPAQTVPAGDTFSFIRLTQANGSDITFTPGASGAIAAGIFSSLTAGSGSHSSSSVYGGVLHATNAGPGIVRGAHLGGFGATGCTGFTSAAALEIQPVVTQAGAWGGFASLTSSGVNGIAVAYGIETNGDTYSIGVGSTIAPAGYVTACYRAWMATASGASARAFQTLQNDGTEIQYIKKTGEVVSSTALIGGTESNGINITAAAITRNNVAGTITIAAGTSSGSVAIQGGGNTGFTVASDGSVAFNASASLVALGVGTLTITNVGPVGSHTSIQGFFKTIINGTTAYIPFF